MGAVRAGKRRVQRLHRGAPAGRRRAAGTDRRNERSRTRRTRGYSKGQKNDFRDAEAIAEAVLRPTMKFVAIKTIEQLDLQGLHRVRERLVCQRTSVINQIRAFLLERGIAVRQGFRALRTEMPIVLAMTDKLSPRMIHMIKDLCTDLRARIRNSASPARCWAATPYRRAVAQLMAGPWAERRPDMTSSSARPA